MLLMKDRSFLSELRAYLIYVKVGEIILLLKVVGYLQVQVDKQWYYYYEELQIQDCLNISINGELFTK